MEGSSWVDYPERFKFHSFEIEVHNSINVTRRECMDLFMCLAEIGGLGTALFGISSLIVSSFADVNTYVIFTNR